MVARDIEGSVCLGYYAHEDDVWELLDKFAENEGCEYAHIVTEEGADEFTVTIDGDSCFGLGSDSFARGCVEWVFYERNDLFCTFMCNSVWYNGDNMTPEIAKQIIERHCF